MRPRVCWCGIYLGAGIYVYEPYVYMDKVAKEFNSYEIIVNTMGLVFLTIEDHKKTMFTIYMSYC